MAGPAASPKRSSSPRNSGSWPCCGARLSARIPCSGAGPGATGRTTPPGTTPCATRRRRGGCCGGSPGATATARPCPPPSRATRLAQQTCTRLKSAAMTSLPSRMRWRPCRPQGRRRRRRRRRRGGGGDGGGGCCRCDGGGTSHNRPRAKEADAAGAEAPAARAPRPACFSACGVESVRGPAHCLAHLVRRQWFVRSSVFVGTTCSITVVVVVGSIVFAFAAAHFYSHQSGDHGRFGWGVPVVCRGGEGLHL
mmetsp:Transcript_72613/g.146133  ORF Transcript_72613/g.146133 Transcript_72613/m.146133 type:complete len:252 (+) Transcript_72613:728-1483(+)